MTQSDQASAPAADALKTAMRMLHATCSADPAYPKSKFGTNSLLTYVAGWAMNQENRMKLAKSSIPDATHKLASYRDVDPWGANRMVTSGELNAVVNRLGNHNHLFASPIAMDSLIGINAKTEGPENRYFPVNINTNHWILFGIEGAGEHKEAHVFSSLDLTTFDLAQIDKVAKELTKKPARKFIADLQKKLPNACGIFVAEAMRRIWSARQVPSSIILEALINQFKTAKPLLQQQFNQLTRQELAGLERAPRSDLFSQTSHFPVVAPAPVATRMSPMQTSDVAEEGSASPMPAFRPHTALMLRAVKA
ncbi:hypothetical protein QTI27_35210 [Variovorax sp. J31P216]|nr:hypothetical protein [Variovorax sp. J31P216]